MLDPTPNEIAEKLARLSEQASQLVEDVAAMAKELDRLTDRVRTIEQLLWDGEPRTDAARLGRMLHRIAEAS